MNIPFGFIRELILLLLGGVLALGGNYVIETIKLRRRRKNIRQIILEELRRNVGFETFPEQANPAEGDLPVQNFVHTAAYEAIIHDLNLLPKQERDAVMEFYTPCCDSRRVHK